MAKAKKTSIQDEIIPHGRGGGDKFPPAITSEDIKEFFNRQIEDQKRINGEVLSFNDVKDINQAAKLCKLFFQHEKPLQTKEAFDKLNEKLNLCYSDAEKYTYLNNALRQTLRIKELFLNGEIDKQCNPRGFQIGYDSEMNKYESWNFTPLKDIDYSKSDAGIEVGGFVHSVIMGSINFKIRSFIISELAKIGKFVKEEESEIIDIPTIDSPRSKLVLLYELGILEKLKQDYSYLNKSQLAALICLLTGIKDEDPKKMNQKAKDLAGDIDPVLYNTKASGKGGYVINPKSVAPVKSALGKLGVKVKRLPDF